MPVPPPLPPFNAVSLVGCPCTLEKDVNLDLFTFPHHGESPSFPTPTYTTVSKSDKK